MKRRWIIGICVICFVAIIAFQLAHIPKKEETPQKHHFLIGMSQANLVEPWRISMNTEFNEAARAHEELRVIYTDAVSDTNRQIRDVEMLMGYGIDLLVISPNDSEALRPMIAEVYKKIPVIVLDRAVSGEDYALFIGPNNDTIGYLEGLRVIEMLGDEGGRVVEILGAADSPPVAERSKGFRRAVTDHPEIIIEAPLVGNWQQDSAEDRFKEFLIANNDFRGVVAAQSDAMAYGAYNAAQKLRVEGIRFVGVDGLNTPDGGIDLVNRGILDTTFYCPTGGKQAVDYALMILEGNAPKSKWLILEPEEIKRNRE